MSAGLIIGLGLGFGVLVLVGVAGALCWCSKRRSSLPHGEERSTEVWKRKVKGKRESKREDSEDSDQVQLNISKSKRIEGDKLMRPRLDSEVETYDIGEEDYGEEFSGYVRSLTGKKTKPGLERVSTEETYENDIKPTNSKAFLQRASTEDAYETDIKKPTLERMSTEEAYETDIKHEFNRQDFQMKRLDTEDDYTYEIGENYC